MVGARLEDVELPLDEYPSLSHFFARRLRHGARIVDPASLVVTAPCDGVVAALGTVEDDHLIQAKGKHYSLRELVVAPEYAASLANGSYITIYLSPKDYHRVHAPIDARLVGYDYVPGTHFPVNPLFSRSIDDLMARNERVIFHLETAIGPMCLVMVAALGVSNVEVAHDRMETRYLRSNRSPRRVRFDKPIDITRGDELGTFHLGSTTILLFPPDQVTLDAISLDDTIHFGQALGRLSESRSRSLPVENSG